MKRFCESMRMLKEQYRNGTLSTFAFYSALKRFYKSSLDTLRLSGGDQVGDSEIIPVTCGKFTFHVSPDRTLLLRYTQSR